jgi:tRNA pseudouridine13 synthase
VLEARRHGHKLRTGHLAGNRFTITVRGVTDGVARARAVLDALAAHGLPNHFGAQRFGARGDNAARGRALLVAARPGERARLGRGERRLLVSAYQAELFNRYLDRRIDDGLLATALLGDVLKKVDTGGLFTVDADALADAQARLAARLVVVTGPMFGHRMRAPPPGTPSAAREQAVLADEALTPDSFRALGALAEGTRRPLLAPVGDAAVAPADEPNAIVLRFTLPPGAYATVLLAEVTKATTPAVGASNV